MHALSNISLSQLTLKLVTLLALITAHRIQTLTQIRLQNIFHLSDRLEIKISDRVKTSSQKRFQPLLVIPNFHENPSLCLASVIDFYVLHTKDIRPAGTDFLILTYVNVSCQRMSKWVKMTITASGIDTTYFSAYSTRHAATSAASRAGVSLEVISRTAGWTQKSEMFAKFYNRPLCTDPASFAEGVLGFLPKHT